MKQQEIKSIAVLMPGSNFSNRWVAEMMDLYAHLLSRFHLRMSWAEGNNIYLTRENCRVQAMEQPHGPPDYLLWLDSDNPPSREGFELRWRPQKPHRESRQSEDGIVVQSDDPRRAYSGRCAR